MDVGEIVYDRREMAISWQCADISPERGRMFAHCLCERGYLCMALMSCQQLFLNEFTRLNEACTQLESSIEAETTLAEPTSH